MNTAQRRVFKTCALGTIALVAWQLATFRTGMTRTDQITTLVMLGVWSLYAFLAAGKPEGKP